MSLTTIEVIVPLIGRYIIPVRLFTQYQVPQGFTFQIMQVHVVHMMGAMGKINV
jgi:hypothetical protein